MCSCCILSFRRRAGAGSRRCRGEFLTMLGYASGLRRLDATYDRYYIGSSQCAVQTCQYVRREACFSRHTHPAIARQLERLALLEYLNHRQPPRIATRYRRLLTSPQPLQGKMMSSVSAWDSEKVLGLSMPRLSRTAAAAMMAI